MAHRAFVLLLLTAGPLYAQQQGIIWLRDAELAVKQAQRDGAPLMIYVVGPTDERGNRTENAQRQAFQDATVMQLSKRFVPLRASTSQNKDLLQQLGVNPITTNLELVFATSDGKRLDNLSAAGASQPGSLAQKMHLVYVKFRNELFSEKIRSVLEDDKSSTKQLLEALGTVQKYTILTADASLIALLKKEKLDKAVHKKALEVLAHLSTAQAIKALFDQAMDSEDAADAIFKATPEAAEQLLVELNGSDVDRSHGAYLAVTKICKIKDAKPEKWWENKNEKLVKDELDRVTQLVRKEAERWKARNEYR